MATGSPYAVTPGALTKDDGAPYRVFSPYARAWAARGVHSPVAAPREVLWTDGGLATDGVPADPDLGDTALPPAGELAALARWAQFSERTIDGYARTRNAPGVDGTSQLSVYLKYGCLHPRTLLAQLPPGDGGDALRRFMQHLRDGDQQGWQWVAGTGTDPSPYFRVFNPVKQGKDHDPDGDYLRRWLPELREVEGPLVHEPWKLPR